MPAQYNNIGPTYFGQILSVGYTYSKILLHPEGDRGIFPRSTSSRTHKRSQFKTFLSSQPPTDPPSINGITMDKVYKDRWYVYMPCTPIKTVTNSVSVYKSKQGARIQEKLIQRTFSMESPRRWRERVAWSWMSTGTYWFCSWQSIAHPKSSQSHRNMVVWF